MKYRKIPKISPGAYIFQRPFLRGLFLEGPIFREAHVRREIWVWKSIGLACSGKEIYHFSFVLLCIRGQIASTSPPWGAYIRRGDLAEGFLRYDFGGLIFGGACTWRGLFSEFYHKSYYKNHGNEIKWTGMPGTGYLASRIGVTWTEGAKNYKWVRLRFGTTNIIICHCENYDGTI